MLMLTYRERVRLCPTGEISTQQLLWAPRWLYLVAALTSLGDGTQSRNFIAIKYGSLTQGTNSGHIQNVQESHRKDVEATQHVSIY